MMLVKRIKYLLEFLVVVIKYSMYRAEEGGEI